MASKAPVSTCVITGLTGSGKSTCLQTLLSSLPETARVAVCVHHHAKAYGLETTPPCPPSFARDDPRLVHYCEVYDFGSGCICCSPNGDLTRELSALARERDENGPRAVLTHAIIETTGLADPRPFTRLISAEGYISKHFSLDRVVTVLRAGDALQRIHEPAPPGTSHNKCAEQLRNSDAVFVSRMDEVPESERQNTFQEVATAVGRVNATARMMRDTLLYPSMEELMTQTRDKSHDHKECGVCEDELNQVVKLVSLAGHDQTYRTTCCVEKGGVIWDRARVWMEQLINTKAALQLKGFLTISSETEQSDHVQHSCMANIETCGASTRTVVVSNDGNKLIVQDVKEMLDASAKHVAMKDFMSARDNAVAEANGCKLFILGTGLMGRDLNDELRACMVPRGFLPLADLDLDFDQVAAAAASRVPFKGKKGVFCEVDAPNVVTNEVALFCVNGSFYALQGKCPHAGHPLHTGDIEDWGELGAGSSNHAPNPCVSCPAHAFVFDLVTGQGMSSQFNAKTYPVRIVGNLIYVGIGKVQSDEV